MPAIQAFMADHHRHCDDLFAEVEQSVHHQAWEHARSAFASFRRGVQQHFETEENLLFPAFEERTGMKAGPTQVMRGEHVQMRELLASCQTALTQHDEDAYAGESETLLIMLQQHNMKEENVLYPMCDQALGGEVEPLLARMQDKLQA